MNEPELKFHCSHCDQAYSCDHRYAGRQVECPACKHLIRIPNPPRATGFTKIQPESGHA